MHFFENVLVLHNNRTSECGVTANILVLGTSDSGFESLHSDKYLKEQLIVALLSICRSAAHELLHVRGDSKRRTSKFGSWNKRNYFEQGEVVL